MSRKPTIFAVLASLLMLGMAASAPVAADDGSLSVSVSQDDAGEVGVSVTHNGSAVAGANVTVETTDENATYDGNGTYVTDANGTVALPAPSEEVEIRVTAEDGNASATTTATIAPVESEDGDGNATDAFGQEVSNFVAELQSNNSTDAPLGVLVANFVLANNPGNAPDHAGPPEWLWNDSVDRPGQGNGGPPDHAGGGNDNGGGPPDHAGPPDDGGDEDDADDEE